MSATAFQRKRREQAKQKELEDQQLQQYENMTVKELKSIAKEKGLEGYSDMKKEELLVSLVGEDSGY